MADDDQAAATLDHIRQEIAMASLGSMPAAPRRVVMKHAPALLKAVEAALKNHRREPLYGNAATEGEPGACPHDPDSSLHFEAGDGSGDWLCEGKPEGAICESCTDREGGERVDWPCQEYQDIRAALLGEAGNGN